MAIVTFEAVAAAAATAGVSIGCWSRGSRPHGCACMTLPSAKGPLQQQRQQQQQDGRRAERDEHRNQRKSVQAAPTSWGKVREAAAGPQAKR